jgi:hypothetical protein
MSVKGVVTGGCDRLGPRAKFSLRVIQAHPQGGAYAYRPNGEGECGKGGGPIYGAGSKPEGANGFPLPLAMISRGFCPLWRTKSRYKGAIAVLRVLRRMDKKSKIHYSPALSSCPPA